MTAPVPLSGDRAAWDSIGYPEKHASDLDAGTPIQHLPGDASDGECPVWDDAAGVWVAEDVTPDLSGYLKLDASNDPMTGDLQGTDFISTRSGTIGRDVDGYVTSIVKTGGRTITFTRDVNHYITEATDGTLTWTYTRDGSNQITAWSVT